MNARMVSAVVRTIAAVCFACYALFASLVAGPTLFAQAVVAVCAMTVAALCSMAAAELLEIAPGPGEDLFDIEQDWIRAMTWLVVSCLCAGGLSLLVSEHPSHLPVGASAWLVPAMFWFTALPALVATVGLRRAMVQMREQF